METQSNRVKMPHTQWTRRRVQKRGSSVVGYRGRYGSGEVTDVHVCPADVGTIDHCLKWIANRRGYEDGWGRKPYIWK